MIKSILKSAVLLCAVSAASACSERTQNTTKTQNETTSENRSADEVKIDILITNGRVHVGDGAPAIDADIAIAGDTIVLIGDASEKTAVRTIDAAGLVVAPGFIDMHTHVDDALSDPALSPILNYVLQGVTTVRPGADGSGSFEIAKTKAQWETNGMGANAVMFAGHRVIRHKVMGNDQLRSPTDAEMNAMKGLVRKAMEEGAWGLSAQLEYGGYESTITTDEMIELTKPVASYGGFYAAHIRNEASKLIDAVNETIAIGEGAGVRTNVTHIKATGRDNWGLMKDAVQVINDARARGVEITADQYPFLQGWPIDYITALIDIPRSMTELHALSQQMSESDLAKDGQAERREVFVKELQAALRDPERREKLRQVTYARREANPSFVARWGWQDFRIKVAVENAAYLEKNIAEIVDEEGRDGFDIIADFVLSEPDMLFAAASQDPDDMRHALVQDWVMISSDGTSALATNAGEPPVRAHPRSFASNAIVFRKFVREEGLLTVAEAIRKMTSLPASLLGFTDRGELKEGYKADIVIFDSETFTDNATYADARRYAAGVHYVIVNGELAVDEGAYTGVRAGKVLLKNQSAAH